MLLGLLFSCAERCDSMPLRVLTYGHFDYGRVADSQLDRYGIHEVSAGGSEPRRSLTRLGFLCHTKSVHCLTFIMQYMSNKDVIKLHNFCKCPTMQTIISGAEFVAGLFTARRLPLTGQRSTTGERQRPLSGGLFFEVLS